MLKMSRTQIIRPTSEQTGDVTIDVAQPREEADARCAQLTDEAKAGQARNDASSQTKRAAGEDRLFIGHDLLNGAHVRRWPSGK